MRNSAAVALTAPGLIGLLGFIAVLALVTPLAAPAAEFSSDRISVVTEGQGSDVLLIPGLSSSRQVWEGLVQALPNHRYHLVQISGFAGQPAGANAEGPILAPVTRELARYIEESGLVEPAVIGHSLGGTVGLMLAARHPGTVGRLMVVDTLPFLGAVFGPPGTTAETIEPLAKDIRERMLAAEPADRRTQAEATVSGMIDTPEARAGPMDDMLASDPNVEARALYETIVTDLTDELAAIDVPTTVLYVNPAAAQSTDAEIAATYRQAYAGLDGMVLERIPDSAHFIMLDQPERFAREVEQFLQ